MFCIRDALLDIIPSNSIIPIGVTENRDIDGFRGRVGPK
jgi:hypothetical protein